jgi:uncharacterized membrane protein
LTEAVHVARRDAPAAGASLRVDVVSLLAVTGIGAVGLALRLRDIGRESMWLDEAGRIAIAQLPVGHIADGVAALELSPPLYHYLLAIWMQLFGSTDVAIRSFSAMLVIPSVGLAWSLGRVVGSTWVAALTALLVAVSPFALHYGQEAAMYALLLLIGLATLRAAIGILEGSRKSRARWLIAYIVCGTLALYTHYYAALLLGTVGLVAMVQACRLRAWHGVVAWIGAHVVIGLAFLPWLPVALQQVRLAASVEDWIGVAPLDAANQWAAALLTDSTPATSTGASLALALVGIALGAWRVRARPTLCALFLALVVLPLAVAITLAGPAHAFRTRGFIAVAPACWLLLAAALAPTGSERGGNQVMRVVFGLALLLITGIGLTHHWGERKEDWRGAAGVVSSRAGAEDPIIFVHFAGEVAFDRYFAGPQPRIGLPQTFTWEEGYRAPYRVTGDKVQRQLPAVLAGKQQAWLVLSHDAGRGSDVVIRYLERWSGGASRFDVPLIGVRVMSYARADASP